VTWLPRSATRSPEPNVTILIRHVRTEGIRDVAGHEQPAPMASDAQHAELGSEFQREFGEPLNHVLDLATWHSGTNLEGLYERVQLDAEIGQALAQEDRVTAAIRNRFFPELRSAPPSSKPPMAGQWSVSVDELEKIHRGTLFVGDVEACDGTVQVHDSLALTVIQIGVGLVGYRGDEGTWSHRLYRRDLRGGRADAYDEAMSLLELRDRRVGTGTDDVRDRLTELGRRGVASYAERAVLTRLSQAPWRMGQGSPAPFELLTGAGSMDLVGPSLDILSELLLDHRQFVFVPSSPRLRALLTVGMALAPLEFAVVHKLRSYVSDIVEHGNLRGRRRARALQFVAEAGEQVAVGIFRASRAAPPWVFYAPAEPALCAQAAAIALADAVLQEHRGFPLLLDMAHQFCVAAFGREEFQGPIQAAYAARGHPMTDLTARGS
jgi:hypothetical protein